MRDQTLIANIGINNFARKLHNQYEVFRTDQGILCKKRQARIGGMSGILTELDERICSNQDEILDYFGPVWGQQLLNIAGDDIFKKQLVSTY